MSKVASSTSLPLNKTDIGTDEALMAAAVEPVLAAAKDLRLPIIPVLPLLNEHSALIETLRAACQAELNSDPDPAMTNHYNDNVFLLRFLLSAKLKLDKATHAVKTAIAWRNKHREALAKVRAGEPIPGVDKFKKYTITDFHGTNALGGPLAVLRNGLCDRVGLQTELSDEEIALCMRLTREVPYIQCDAETRKRGYFVKMITVMDMAHLQFTRAMDRQWISQMGAIATEMELVYPQLLGATVAVNPPTWFKVMWTLASPFMPQSTKEKMVVCGHKHATWKAHKSDARKCPFAAQYTDPAALPTFLGGQCKCNADPVNFPEGRCICGIDNRRQTLVTEAPLPLR